MGYTIEYHGSFKLDKPLTEEHAQFLKDFSRTRHYQRAWKPEEENGRWFVDPDGKCEPDFFDEEYQKVVYNDGKYNHEARKEYELKRWNVVDFNEVNQGMPSYYCQWVPTEDNAGIKWDENEKFYGADKWLKYIIESYLKPWGYVLNGKVAFEYGEREYGAHSGVITVEDNEITVIIDNDY